MFDRGVKIKTNIFCVIKFGLIFLTGYAQMSPIVNAQNNEHSAEVRSIDPNNHNAVAKYYEDVAKEMKAKLREQKERLEEYERHNYYYGRKGQNFRSHTWANIRDLENSIKENLKEAAIYWEMARNQQKREFSLITE